MIGWLYLSLEWLIRLAMLPVVTRRRRTSSAVAWLAVIFFLPVVGLVLYLIFGGRRLGRGSARSHAQATERIAALRPRFEARPDVRDPVIRSHRADLAHLAFEAGRMRPLGGNEASFIGDTQILLDRLVEDIDAARHHVHLLYYIFRDDDSGRRVSEALTRAVARGVQARLLVDAVGSRPMLGSLAPHLRKAGVLVRPTLPASILRAALQRIDLRNHRKIAVIDARTAYSGSQNIADADYGHKRLGAWEDLSVRLTGPAVLQLQEVFLHDWYFTTGEVLDDPAYLREHDDSELAGDLVVQTVPSGPDYPDDAFLMFTLAAIQEAHERISITSPYFIPDESVVLALRVAAMRDLKVDVIVPARTDNALVNAAARSYYADLLEAGVRIHLHQRGLLHAKSMTVDDDLAVIGSANLDMRSFHLNFEVTQVFYGVSAAEKLQIEHARYVSESVPLLADQWRNRPRAVQIADNIARLFSPLL